ncbi:sulfate adenylyltransferase subunit CysN [Methylobacterium komagatae]|uniref:sulfate adenylyltransferase n=1 Tax=Methylobacterium komagatae TaxID=374425 RepID=A0ABW2BN21_9HYPH
MTIHQSKDAFQAAGLAKDYATFLETHRNKEVLRFIACGSVDDGKSTLIGRLLHDTKQIFDDQITALRRDSRKHGTQGQEMDLALLVDGLQAEREQGITIDVAYRFFSTDKRSFIVADTPGHEQYTRNMATGASTADVAVILVDARQGLTRQTRRHALLVSMLGIRRVVLAVNKMDMIGWAQDRFAEIVKGFSEFAAGLHFAEIRAIPLSAKNGDNVVEPGVNTPWHTGGTLLSFLETVPVREEALNAPFRMGVQWVNRPNSEFRGYSGRIASGTVRPGDRVSVQPGGRTATVERIYTADGDLAEAGADLSVTLVLAEQIDASRGQVIAAEASPLHTLDRLDARLFWAAETDLAPGASLYAKIGTATVTATVEAIVSRIDPETGKPGPADKLSANDIADVRLTLDRPVAVDAYAANRETGSFILIDRETTDTAALGLVLAPHQEAKAAPQPVSRQEAPSSGGFLGSLKRLFGR